MKREYELTHREFLKVSLPFILSTVTMPLLGAVDMAVVGNLNDVTYIGGVSIGVTVFNTIYWIFGFLRVITTGYSAQALGANDKEGKIESFVYPFIMAMVIGFCIIFFSRPIWNISMNVLSPELGVIEQAKSYYFILIWGAPFVLFNYVILGWLMGQARIRISVSIQIVGNLMNILLDILFVSIFSLNVEGVAMATLISQVFTFFLGVLSIYKNNTFAIDSLCRKELWSFKKVIRKAGPSFDFIIRTCCLLIVNNIFMAKSAALGTIVLAANSIILQFEGFIAYIFEGLANGASVFAGKSVGYKSDSMLRAVIKKTVQWTIIFIIFLTIVYTASRYDLVYLFTDIEEVIESVNKYGAWLVMYPLTTGLGLSIYGVFTGVMYTKAIKYSTILSTALFVTTSYIFIPSMGNDGLWLALIMYYLGRTVFLMPYVKGLCIEK